MDVNDRVWWIRLGDKEEGPIDEEAFQDRLRSGDIPLKADIKSDRMKDWEPLLSVVSTDETFKRKSTLPPPEPQGDGQ